MNHLAKMLTYLSVCCLILASGLAGASTTVLKAARYLDVETGNYVSPAVIVVNDKKIESINPATEPDAAVLDVGGMTILPGLMDAHTHLTYDIGPGWTTEAVRFTSGEFALRGALNAKKTLMAGFTTVRDVGANGFTNVALSNAIKRDWVPGPDVIPAGYALGVTGGHCDITGFAPGVREADFRTGVADGTEEFE